MLQLRHRGNELPTSTLSVHQDDTDLLLKAERVPCRRIPRRWTETKKTSLDGGRDQRARHADGDDRPPGRRHRVPQRDGQVVPHQVLELAHRGEEAVRGVRPSGRGVAPDSSRTDRVAEEGRIDRRLPFDKTFLQPRQLVSKHPAIGVIRAHRGLKLL